LISFDDAVAPWPYKSAFNEPLQIPNLDEICKVSTAFHSAYCQLPVCGASRASFMSGLSPFKTGIFRNSDDVFLHHDADIMWSYRLKQAGYYCSFGGKVHHRVLPRHPKVFRKLYSDKPKKFAQDKVVPSGVETTHFGGIQKGVAFTNPEDDDKFYDYDSANSAIEFLENYASDAPFYREVGFYSPHGPFHTPLRFKTMYDEAALVQPESWITSDPMNEFADTYFPKSPPMANKRVRWWKQSVRSYYSAYSHGDHHLGRLWRALKNSRHADNTIVIILADHGFHLGNRDRFQKSTLWEQVAAVPLVIRDPDAATGKIVSDPVALIDVGPTVMDMLGMDHIKDCPGQSLSPIMNGATDPHRAIPTFSVDSASVRYKSHRFIRYADGSTELFDLSNDYWQINDLGRDSPIYSEISEQLDACYAQYAAN
jgi:arylsulfatase A-like enzyme